MDKSLEQIESILDGTGRYKFLDCSRTDLYDLPAGAFKLWHVIYRMESPEQEAFPSLNTLIRESRMDRKTVIKWKKYLLDTGWLITLEGSAADHYSKPSQGSHRVPVIRVDDPKRGSGISPIGEEKGEWNNSAPKTPPNVVIASVVVSEVEVRHGPDTKPSSKPVEVPTLSLPPSEGKAETEAKTNATTKAKTPPSTLAAAAKQKERYGESFPAWMNDYKDPSNPNKTKAAWTQARSEWIFAHTPEGREAITHARDRGRPLPFDPPSLPKFKCPYNDLKGNPCGFGCKWEYVLTNHIREFHADELDELGEAGEGLRCPEGISRVVSLAASANQFPLRLPS